MTEADNAFIEEHAGFVNGIARGTRRQLGLDSDLEDLVAFGYRGLLEARERYDADKGVAFKTFAYYRVRGAIVDGIRKMAHLPRRAYARMRAVEALDDDSEFAAETLAKTPASDGEAALRVMDGILGTMAAAYCVAAGIEEEASDERSPEQALLRRERKTRTLEAIAALPERERYMVEGHYLKGRRLDELAAEIGLSKSWGSRLHSRALALLRDALEEDDAAADPDRG